MSNKAPAAFDARAPRLNAKEWGKIHFWPTQPHCLGYDGGCDGDLEGEEHISTCPMSGKQPVNMWEFAEAYAAYTAGQAAPATATLSEEQVLEKVAQWLEVNHRDDDDEQWEACCNLPDKIRALLRQAVPVSAEGTLTYDEAIDLVQEAIGQWGGPERKHYDAAMKRVVSNIRNHQQGLDLWGTPLDSPARPSGTSAEEEGK